MGIENNIRVEEFLNEILLKVKNKEAHEEIKLEFMCHIEELYEKYKESGMGEEEAIRNSIAHMGNPDIIGEKLDKAHRGKPEWGIVIAVTLMSFLGIFLTMFIGASGILRYNSSKNSIVMIVSLLIGMNLAVLLYRFDYRKLKKYSTHIFMVTNLMMIIAILFGNNINGMKYIIIGSISIDICEVYLFLMCICLPQILSSFKFEGILNYLKFILLYIIPTILIAMVPDMFHVFLYTCIFVGMLISNKFSLKLILSIPIVFISTIIFYIVNVGPYAKHRLLAFLIRDNDGCGYINNIFIKIINGASLVGKGNGISIDKLPEPNTDFIFAYIIHSFGWIVTGVIIVLVTFFIVRLFKSSKLIKDDFGKSIIISLALVFSIQFIWNILMTFNLLPIMSVGFPFVSYGGTSMIINIISIGLVMGIYKRKSYAYTI